MPNADDLVVRPFARSDRDQVTQLANAHVAAVVPGASISTASLLSHLEREPGEFIEDPWIIERVTLVAEQRHRIVAAAHLQRYSDSPEAPPALCDQGAIRWLLCWPDSPFWPDAGRAGAQLLDACLALLARWRVSMVSADGTLPVPGVYGVPEQWPHVLSLLRQAGFGSAGRSEIVLMALVHELPGLASAVTAWPLTAVRTLGQVGTRITALRDGEAIGVIELDTALDAGSQRSRHEGLADIGNLWVEPGCQRHGAGTWLMAQARRWLELGGVTRLLAYTAPDEGDALAFLKHCGFQVLTTTVRDLRLP